MWYQHVSFINNFFLLFKKITFVLSQDKYSTDTSVDVIWTCGLSTKSHAVLNTVTGSSLLSAVNTNHIGTYTSTAQVVYTGS